MSILASVILQFNWASICVHETLNRVSQLAVVERREDLQVSPMESRSQDRFLINHPHGSVLLSSPLGESLFVIKFFLLKHFNY